MTDDTQPIGDNGVDYWSYANHIIEDDALCILVRGNNDWSKSNLRTWLNSDKEAVAYADQAPTKKAVGNGYYNTEPGFLHGFSAKEKKALVLTTNKTTANAFSENVSNNKVTTKDYVYLLSSDELSLLSKAGMHIYAKPSEACVKQDKNAKEYTSFQANYISDNYYYWLRDHASDSKCNEAYFVVTECEDGYTILPTSVGVPNYGVRPVITVKPTDELKPSQD